MVSFLAIIGNSLSKQLYRSFSNINYGSIIGGGDEPSSTIFLFVLESHLLRFIAPAPYTFFGVIY